MRSSNTSLNARSRVLSLLCAAAWSAGTAYGMDPDRAMTQYLRDRWGPEQGFPRGSVYAIAQSSDGYLWIGTHAGLVRYDGWNFRLIGDAPGLQKGESVFNLRADREGTVWIGFSGTLVRYRDGVFDSPVNSLRARITAMTQANGGDLLISAMERGAMIYRHGQLEMAADASGMPRSPVLAIAQTSDGSIWSGTRGAGVFRFRDGKSIFAEGLPNPKVNCLLAGADGDLWLGTDRGIAHWNGQRIVSVGLSEAGDPQVLALARDRDGNIWAGTDAGRLVRINRRGVAFLDPPAGRPQQAITALREDREGSLWIGSDSGIERLRDSAFVTYSGAEGLPSDGNNPVFVDSDHRMWFSPVDGGLWWMKDGHHGAIANDGLNRDVVYSIAGGAKGELWLGRQHGGLTRVRSSGSSFIVNTYTKADGLSAENIFSVYAASDGSVWAGTLSGGVSRFSGGRFSTYTTAHGLLSNTISAIAEGPDGTIWFATPGGLSALVNGNWQSYTKAEGLPSENVYCLLNDSTGVLWIGTAAGLVFRGPRGIQSPLVAQGPLKEAVLGIAEDRLGSLWVATSNHVMRVKRSALLNGTLRDGDLREYGTADGLRGLEGVRRHRSVIADPAGRIW